MLELARWREAATRNDVGTSELTPTDEPFVDRPYVYPRNMDAIPAATEDPAWASSEPVVYRVRIWTPPPSEISPWYLDEWDIHDAENVTAVIDWAASQTPDDGRFEVFVPWIDHAVQARVGWSPRKRFTRVFGETVEAASVTETVIFTKPT